ncbi:MAG: hypothetical protein N2318_10835 [Meiothermus sp.]|nr:hypothetical protein [Meiothermus sp.]
MDIVSRTILLFLLFLAALPLPAAFVAAAAGNVQGALGWLAMSTVFIAGAVIYAALAMHEREE